LAFGGAANAFAKDNAASLYRSKCRVCHGPEGKGDTTPGKMVGAGDFHAPVVTKKSDAELFEIIKKGKGKMPPYDKKLTDDQIRP
jgi:mono/diheme cytochrome c family protein